MTEPNRRTQDQLRQGVHRSEVASSTPLSCRAIGSPSPLNISREPVPLVARSSACARLTRSVAWPANTCAPKACSGGSASCSGRACGSRRGRRRTRAPSRRCPVPSRRQGPARTPCRRSPRCWAPAARAGPESPRGRERALAPPRPAQWDRANTACAMTPTLGECDLHRKWRGSRSAVWPTPARRSCPIAIADR